MRKHNYYSVILSESIIIGFYSLFISLVILHIFKSQNILLCAFIIGFIKHFIGGISGLHKIYCYQYLYGKCKNYNYNIKKLILESILEGILFIILRIILTKLKSNEYTKFFVIGLLLHIIFEIIGIHKIFCKKICIKQKI